MAEAMHDNDITIPGGIAREFVLTHPREKPSPAQNRNMFRNAINTCLKK